MECEVCQEQEAYSVLPIRKYIVQNRPGITYLCVTHMPDEMRTSERDKRFMLEKKEDNVLNNDKEN